MPSPRLDVGVLEDTVVGLRIQRVHARLEIGAVADDGCHGSRPRADRLQLTPVVRLARRQRRVAPEQPPPRLRHAPADAEAEIRDLRQRVEVEAVLDIGLRRVGVVRLAKPDDELHVGIGRPQERGQFGGERCDLAGPPAQPGIADGRRVRRRQEVVARPVARRARQAAAGLLRQARARLAHELRHRPVLVAELQRAERAEADAERIRHRHHAVRRVRADEVADVLEEFRPRPRMDEVRLLGAAEVDVGRAPLEVVRERATPVHLRFGQVKPLGLRQAAELDGRVNPDAVRAQRANHVADLALAVREHPVALRPLDRAVGVRVARDRVVQGVLPRVLQVAHELRQDGRRRRADRVDVQVVVERLVFVRMAETARRIPLRRAHRQHGQRLDERGEANLRQRRRIVRDHRPRLEEHVRRREEHEIALRLHPPRVRIFRPRLYAALQPVADVRAVAVRRLVEVEAHRARLVVRPVDLQQQRLADPAGREADDAAHAVAVVRPRLQVCPGGGRHRPRLAFPQRHVRRLRERPRPEALTRLPRRVRRRLVGELLHGRRAEGQRPLIGRRATKPRHGHARDEHVVTRLRQNERLGREIARRVHAQTGEPRHAVRDGLRPAARHLGRRFRVLAFVAAAADFQLDVGRARHVSRRLDGIRQRERAARRDLRRHAHGLAGREDGFLEDEIERHARTVGGHDLAVRHFAPVDAEVLDRRREPPVRPRPEADGARLSEVVAEHQP